MLSKTQDPLIRAEAEKKLKEQKQLYQKEFQQSIQDIDRNFQLKKQELLRLNDEEIDQERHKWESYKKEQEKKIREEMEQDVDAKL